MNSDAVFALENAAWPALLVDGATTIRRANRSAITLFGGALESGSAPLSTIWSPDSGTTPEQFLTQWERSPSATISLGFIGQGGDALAYAASICSFADQGQKYFLLQLWPEAAPASLQAKNQATEATLAHKQKLDCALQLARTVSLDFNNALTSILGHTSLFLSKIEPNHPWRGSLLEVEKSAAKAAEIASDLGAFSRQEKPTSAQAAGNVNLVLERCVETFRKNPRAEAVRWTLQLERKLFSAKFDEAKMQQAFMKILENALEALRADGRVGVQTRNLELGEPAQDREVRLAAGAYVCVEITDDGCGIAPEVLPRIFEPFFTTKRDASHRGLGLAWVYGIVTNHGGGVAVSSQPGSGTSVRVYLPAENRIVKASSPTAGELSGTETILMVDDEELLLRMGQTILSSFGYTVLTATGGQKALDILSQNGKSVDLVLTDLVMPAMSGRELVEQIRERWPDIRILCTSGYVRPANQQEEGAFLQKPFTTQDLLLKVKQALSGMENPA